MRHDFSIDELGLRVFVEIVVELFAPTLFILGNTLEMRNVVEQFGRTFQFGQGVRSAHSCPHYNTR